MTLLVRHDPPLQDVTLFFHTFITSFSCSILIARLPVSYFIAIFLSRCTLVIGPLVILVWDEEGSEYDPVQNSWPNGRLFTVGPYVKDSNTITLNYI